MVVKHSKDRFRKIENSAKIIPVLGRHFVTHNGGIQKSAKSNSKNITQSKNKGVKRLQHRFNSQRVRSADTHLTALSVFLTKLLDSVR